MTTEEKAKRYDGALHAAKAWHNTFINTKEDKNLKQLLETIFPELAESDDERIRKQLICGMNALKDQKNETFAAIPIDDCITWLEKQGNKPKKVSIWKHWKDGIAGGASDEQVFLQKIGRNYCISSCLGCECDYIELSELDKLMREERQGKPKWNEEDDYNLQCCIAKAESDVANYYTVRNKELFEWLKSLKQRMEE